MRKVGIICEYNPFHNGHAYQIQEAKRIFGAEAAVCIMSGNYVQRGEPAICDKWTRAGWALTAGADLVIELPTLWASAGAPDFAQGAVNLLHVLGVDAISCGVEEAALAELQLLAHILTEESDSFRNTLQEELKKGSSFVRSREKAVISELQRRGERVEIARLLHSSNNILAIEYMRAAEKLNWKVPFVLVKRKGAEHNSSEEKEGYLSASRIRQILREAKEPLDALPIPLGIRDELMHCSLQQTLHPDASGLQSFLYYRVTMMSPEELRKIEGMGEGLEYALIKACSRFESWQQIVDQLTALRYPSSRIRRLLLNVCLGITQEMVEAWKETIPYLKVLCFNEIGQSVIRDYQKQWKKKQQDLALVDKNTEKSGAGINPVNPAGPVLLTNPGREEKWLDERSLHYLRQESRWTDLYELTRKSPAAYQKGKEYRMNAVKIAK